MFTVWASPVQKRLGVPVKAERECRQGANYSTDIDDCTIFYICDHGWPKITPCPPNTFWTPLLERCEGPAFAINDECGYVATTLSPEEVAIDIDDRGK